MNNTPALLCSIYFFTQKKSTSTSWFIGTKLHNIEEHDVNNLYSQRSTIYVIKMVIMLRNLSDLIKNDFSRILILEERTYVVKIR